MLIFCVYRLDVQDDPEEMQGPVDDSEENLQFSFNRSKSLDYEYLSFVTGGYFQDGVISTSNTNDNDIRKERSYY